MAKLNQGLVDIIGSNIKRLREEKAMSRNDLAEKINVTVQAISQYENCKRLPNDSMLTKIADALAVSKTQLTTSFNPNDFSALFKKLSNAFDDPNNLMCIRPLSKKEIVEYFRCIALSVGLSDLLPESDEALYILLNSQEFEACIDLLTCKYKDVKIKRYGNKPIDELIPNFKEGE